MRLDTLPVLAPWQAPATAAELIESARAQGIDVVDLLRPLWKHLRGQSVCFLIVGAPIPERDGGGASVMHWQALVLPALGRDATRGQRKRAEASPLRLAETAAPLSWIAQSENWHPDAVENRGRLGPALRAMRVVLAGAGALGSALADVLVRMGVHDLVIVDPQRYEAGNGVRHRLTLAEVGVSKAGALADRLNAASPSARVRGYAESLPSDRPEIAEAIAAADLVLDCTASDALMRALPGIGFREDAWIVSASVGLHAERLFLFADRAGTFSAEAFDTWFGPYRSDEHARAVAEGLPQAAGCWQPVTPVPFHRLLGQVATLAERLDALAAAGPGPVADVLGQTGMSVVAP